MRLEREDATPRRFFSSRCGGRAPIDKKGNDFRMLPKGEEKVATEAPSLHSSSPPYSTEGLPGKVYCMLALISGVDRYESMRRSMWLLRARKRDVGAALMAARWRAPASLAATKCWGGGGGGGSRSIEPSTRAPWS